MSDHSSESVVRYKSLDFLGFPQHRVGSDGTLWTKSRGNKWKLRKTKRTDKGYNLVLLQRHDRTKGYHVHRLVLLAFGGPCPEGMQCRHLNGDPTDNRIENLKWGTPKENAADRRKHKGYITGVNHIHAKLTEESVGKIRKLYESGEYSKRAIGRMFGVSAMTIIQVVKRITWKQVP